MVSELEKPAVSVIIAAHQEAATIAEVVERALAATPPPCEVIVVDDGSTDATADRAATAGASVVRLEHNRGKGVAVRAGIAEARGELLLFLDADGQDDATEIPRLLQAMEPGIDMAIGSRFLGELRPGAITALHRAGNRFLTGVVNLACGSRISDAMAGFRVIRRGALARQRLRAERYDIEAEVLVKLLATGARVVERPVTRHARPYGRSGFRTFRDGLRILGTILVSRLTANAR